MIVQGQRNQLAEIFRGRGLRVSDASVEFFDGDERHSYGGRVTVVPKKIFFEFQNTGSNRFNFICKPIVDLHELTTFDHESMVNGLLWNDLCVYFSNWCTAVKKEQETPDMWAKFKQEETTNLQALANFYKTGPIPVEQQEVLRLATLELKKRILEILPTKEDQVLVGQKLDQCVSLLATADYQQWKLFFLNLIISVMLTYPGTQNLIRGMLAAVGQTVANAIATIGN